MDIIWSPLAENRLIEIAEYIAYDKPAVAIQWAESVFDATQELLNHPKLGRKVPEFNNEKYREILHGNYRIIYRLDEIQIMVLTVRRGSQLLSEDDLGE